MLLMKQLALSVWQSMEEVWQHSQTWTLIIRSTASILPPMWVYQLKRKDKCSCCDLVDYHTTRSDKWLQTPERKTLPLTSGQIEAASSSETLLPTYQTTGCHIHKTMMSVFATFKSSHHKSKMILKGKIDELHLTWYHLMHSHVDMKTSDILMKVTASECQILQN